ncbi:MAG: PRC-barrel domain-containing protein, partial [Desulfobacterales bacterium]
MKKTSIVVMAIAFACALFVGQAFADEMKGDKEKWQAKETNRASEFIGKNVQNDQDEELGSVNDVLFNHKGQISYIILSRGGIAGIGEDLVPVPFKAEKLTIREDVIVL